MTPLPSPSPSQLSSAHDVCSSALELPAQIHRRRSRRRRHRRLKNDELCSLFLYRCFIAPRQVYTRVR